MTWNLKVRFRIISLIELTSQSTLFQASLRFIYTSVLVLGILRILLLVTYFMDLIIKLAQ